MASRDDDKRTILEYLQQRRSERPDGVYENDLMQQFMHFKLLELRETVDELVNEGKVALDIEGPHRRISLA